jgi:isoleucyl-tRNA synthetase
MGQVSKELASLSSSELITRINKKEPILISIDNDEVELETSDFIISEDPKDGFSVSSSVDYIVGIAIEITDELRSEGIVRDLIRKVQNLRKDSGLKVEDRICVGIECSDDIATAINTHQLYFMNEVLGVDLMHNIDDLDHKQLININGDDVVLAISIKN